MTPDEILAMAKEAGLTDPDLEDWVTEYGNAKDEIIMFAALVAAKAAAKERARLFGADRQFDGQMRLQLTRWEGGECFAVAKHFSSEQTHCGSDSMLQLAVDELDKQIDACIDAAIRARGAS